MERAAPFESSEFYHLYNRGVDKQPIFLDQHDWVRFQLLLRLCNSSRPVKIDRCGPRPYTLDYGERITDIIAYALMPNHFHLLLRERVQGGTSKFMGKLLTSYSMYFNKKRERSGPVMCRPFRSSHIDSDEYFRWVFSYLHLNHQHVLFARTYSSYPDYFLTKRKEATILTPEASPIPLNELLQMDTMHEFFAAAKAAGIFDSTDKFLAR